MYNKYMDKKHDEYDVLIAYFRMVTSAVHYCTQPYDQYQQRIGNSDKEKQFRIDFLRGHNKTKILPIYEMWADCTEDIDTDKIRDRLIILQDKIYKN